MKNNRNKTLITGLLVIIGILFAGGACAAPTELTLKPDHLDMLVSLDGEFDEYYEELTLLNNGKRVDSKKARWQSENPEIAEVDEDGWVTSMGVGTTTITAEYKGATVQCTVEVTQKITSDTLGD